jgi:hypothetical protein
MATVGTQQQIPPLAPATAGRWLDVTCDDPDMIVRFLRVMYQMDPIYLREGVSDFVKCPAHRPLPWGASYFYWESDTQLALRLIFSCDWRRHQIMSLGFLGTMPHRQALDLVVERCISYLRERDAGSAVAIVPKRRGHPNMRALYQLVPSHPRVRFRLDAQSKYAERWILEAPELAPPGGTAP